MTRRALRAWGAVERGAAAPALRLGVQAGGRPRSGAQCGPDFAGSAGRRALRAAERGGARAGRATEEQGRRRRRGGLSEAMSWGKKRTKKTENEKKRKSQ